MAHTVSLGFSPADALFHHRYKLLSRQELEAELEKLYTNREIVQTHIKAANMALEAIDSGRKDGEEKGR